MTPFQYRINFWKDNRVEIIYVPTEKNEGMKMRKYFNEKTIRSYSCDQHSLNISKSVHTFLSIDCNP